MTVNEKAIKYLLDNLKEGKCPDLVGVTDALLRLQGHDEVVARLNRFEERLSTMENKLAMARVIERAAQERPRGL